MFAIFNSKYDTFYNSFVNLNIFLMNDRGFLANVKSINVEINPWKNLWICVIFYIIYN